MTNYPAKSVDVMGLDSVQDEFWNKEKKIHFLGTGAKKRRI